MQGYLQFYDDSVFIGEFKMTNKFHGMGRLTYQQGVYYFGNWSNGQKTGEGEEVYFDGSKYTGSFQSNKRHG